MISKGGDFLITDFGISKQLKNTLKKSAGNLNSAGSISYMGPERFSKQSLPIKASDIWSLGATVYEMAVGELPFCGMGGSMQKKGADIPELPDTYSDTLNMVMMSCLALEPWSRPTARQLEDFAAKHLAGDSPQMTWAAPSEPQVQQPAFRQTVAVTEAVAPIPQYQSSSLKRTVAVGQMPQMEAQTIPAYTPVQPEPRKSVPAIFWVLAVVAGLATGVLLNILM